MTDDIPRITWHGCHCCGTLPSDEVATVDQSKYAGQKCASVWLRCRNCGTVYQREVPERRPYFRAAKDWDRTDNPTYQSRTRMMAEWLGDTAGRAVCDVGAGTGWLIRLLQQYGDYARCAAVEIPGEDISHLTQFGIETYQVQLELEPMPEALVGAFDHVLNWELMEHVYYPATWFQIMAKMLKPGGLLLVRYCPDTERNQAKIRGPSEWRFPTLDGLILPLQRAGFEIVKVTRQRRRRFLARLT